MPASDRRGLLCLHSVRSAYEYTYSGRGLSPDDPKFYAPPRWRSGAVAAPPIQPSLGESELPSQVAAESTPAQYEMRFVAKKQSSAKRKRKECRFRLRPSRGSNLPNNGVSWRTGVKNTRAEFLRTSEQS